jgi:MarR family 2-MHQ and catechol resistance regulon transcriptional repressor
MDDFKALTPNKFLIVLGKMHASVFGKVSHHIKELGYNTTEFLILYAIAANGPLTIQDIGARIAMTSGNMTYTVDKLEHRGLIQRLRCNEDRRKIFIDFTDEGKGQWQSIMEDLGEYLKEVFNEIDEEALLETIEAMKLIGKTFAD